MKAVSTLGEGGEEALSSGTTMLGRVFQLQATLWCVTISWPACLLASAQGAFSHSLSPCHSSQVNRPQAMRGNYCTCSCSFASMNDKKRLPLLRIIVSLILAGFLMFYCFQNELELPGTQSFSIFGSGWVGYLKKSSGRVGYRDPVRPWLCEIVLPGRGQRSTDWDRNLSRL